MGEGVTGLDSDALYERYGKSLEQAEQGKYVAISQDGRIIVDVDDVLVVDQAIQQFGSGNFVFRRIGYSYVDKVRRGEEGECSPAFGDECLIGQGIIKRLKVTFDHGRQVLVEQ